MSEIINEIFGYFFPSQTHPTENEVHENLPSVPPRHSADEIDDIIMGDEQDGTEFAGKENESRLAMPTDKANDDAPPGASGSEGKDADAESPTAGAAQNPPPGASGSETKDADAESPTAGAAENSPPGASGSEAKDAESPTAGAAEIPPPAGASGSEGKDAESPTAKDMESSPTDAATGTPAPPPKMNHVDGPRNSAAVLLDSFDMDVDNFGPWSSTPATEGGDGQRDRNLSNLLPDDDNTPKTANFAVACIRNESSAQGKLKIFSEILGIFLL
jgi:hypothetical protein